MDILALREPISSLTHAAGFVFAIPVHAYVEKIYETVDYAALFGFGA